MMLAWFSSSEMMTSSFVRIDETVPALAVKPLWKTTTASVCLNSASRRSSSMWMAIVPAIVRTEPEPTPNCAHGLERALAQPRMRRQAEVVVRREVDDAAAVERRVRPLLVVEDAQAAVEALRLQGIELVGQELERVAAGRGRHGSYSRTAHGIREHLVVPELAKRGALRGAEPGGHVGARPARKRGLVDDHVGRAGGPQPGPGRLGVPEHVPQGAGVGRVRLRNAAAVAVDEPPPVQGRGEHVADVERLGAERELSQHGVVPERLHEAVQGGRVGRARKGRAAAPTRSRPARSDRAAAGPRRPRRRRAVRVPRPTSAGRPSRAGGRARTVGGEHRQAERHDHRVARRHAQPVVTRHVLVQPPVRRVPHDQRRSRPGRPARTTG